MAVPFTAGQRVLASDLNTATQQAAWTSYAVAWTSSGTAPAVGNGTMVGYYSKVGRIVTVKISLTTGSTTTYGSGNYTFSVPFTAAVTGVATSAIAHTGEWTMLNNGVTFYTASAAILQSIPGQIIGLVNGSASFMGATNPATWTGSGTQFACTLTYESTS